MTRVLLDWNQQCSIHQPGNECELECSYYNQNGRCSKRGRSRVGNKMHNPVHSPRPTTGQPKPEGSWSTEAQLSQLYRHHWSDTHTGEAVNLRLQMPTMSGGILCSKLPRGKQLSFHLVGNAIPLVRSEPCSQSKSLSTTEPSKTTDISLTSCCVG